MTARLLVGDGVGMYVQKKMAIGYGVDLCLFHKLHQSQLVGPASRKAALRADLLGNDGDDPQACLPPRMPTTPTCPPMRTTSMNCNSFCIRHLT